MFFGILGFMGISVILYNIIIAPLETIIEAVFCFELERIRIFGVGGAIVAVSLAVGFLTLPIYNVADAIQKRERDTQAHLARWVNHIRKNFKGDERFMMLSYYYKQNNYHPLYALRSSLSIMIEVPFFIAAFHFLSHCPSLQGVACGVLRDLSKPDNLIVLGEGLSLNLLPILMTAINVVSSAVYLKGFSAREKAQTYALAAIFLVLLYNSPSGLVLYWTLNNLFSLAKNIVQRWGARVAGRVFGAASMWGKATVVYGVLAGALLLVATIWMARGVVLLGRPGKYRLLLFVFACVWGALPFEKQVWKDGLLGAGFGSSASKKAFAWHAVCASVLAVVMLGLIALRYATFGNMGTFRTMMFLLAVVWLGAPVVGARLSGVQKLAARVIGGKVVAGAGHFALFLASAVGMALLCGLVLPSSVIATSPAEFSFIGNIDNPIYYVWHSLTVFAGLFVLWPVVLYKMFGGKVRRAMPYIFAFAFVMALLNVYVFGYNYGTMDHFIKLSDARKVFVRSPFYTLLPIIVGVACIALLILSNRFCITKYIVTIMVALCMTECVLGTMHMRRISTVYTEYVASKGNDTIESMDKLPKVYHLSKTNKNVVVLFLDRAISSFFPYIVRQFPQLADKFDGFVYYPNTLSFAGGTVGGSPAMMGGYEYTPEEMNKRKDELLVDKHNEAMLVAPRLFSEAGWQVIITNPPFSNYKWTDDFTPFDMYPDIKCSSVQYRYTNLYLNRMRAKGELGDEDKKVLLFSAKMVSSHVMAFSLVETIYPVFRKTFYNNGHYYRTRYQSSLPFVEKSVCLGLFAHMYYLGDLTDCDATSNTYTFIGSSLTHNVEVLKEPEYEPADSVDEKKATCGYYKWKLAPSDVGENNDLAHYHVNAAAMLQTARWLDKLRNMDIYDNTRIIIVADHGRNIPTPAFGAMERGEEYASYNPLLMFKDFDAHGKVSTDNTLMTNADTLFLAKKGLSISDINPFTGKNLVAQINKSVVRICPPMDFGQGDPEVYLKNKNKKVWTFDKKGHLLAVHDNIFDERNWRRLDTEAKD